MMLIGSTDVLLVKSIYKCLTVVVHEQGEDPPADGPRLRLRVTSATDAGQQRTHNEDAPYTSERMIAVADGMGGHAYGEVASTLVIEALTEADEQVAGGAAPLAVLGEVTATVVRRIGEQVEQREELRGMGATMTAMCFDGEDFVIAHIGDSRAYVLRDGELRSLTRDHTLVRVMVDEGKLSEQEAAVHPRRSVLFRALQVGADPTPDLTALDTREGDRYLVCSDGLTDVVDEESIGSLMRERDGIEAAAEALVEAANAGGGPDNITVALADVCAE